MASGKAHFEAATKAAWAVTVVSIPLAVVHPALAVGMASAGVAGVYIHPDLDVDRDGEKVRTHEQYVIERYSPLLARLWSMFWNRYAVSRFHRGLSHEFATGTLDRWMYIFIRTFPIWIALFVLFPEFMTVFALAAFPTMCAMDGVHLVLDKDWRVVLWIRRKLL